MTENLVLAVDDDSAIREMVRMLLAEVLGLDVDLAADGDSALELACCRRPALVLLDIDLPGLSGLEVARRLKADARTRDIPLVAVTGRPWHDVAGAGFDGYVGKPFGTARLLAEVSKQLASSAREGLEVAA